MQTHPNVVAVQEALDAAGTRAEPSSAPQVLGVPRAVFPITHAELLRVTAGTATDVA